jgi:hypothetical protein
MIRTALHPLFAVLVTFRPCSRKTRKTSGECLQEYIRDIGIGDERLDPQPEDACEKKHVVRPIISVVIFAYFCHTVL